MCFLMAPPGMDKSKFDPISAGLGQLRATARATRRRWKRGAARHVAWLQAVGGGNQNLQVTTLYKWLRINKNMANGNLL